MAFYDTKLGNHIENAFQALGLDERRGSFSPAIWEKPDGNRTRLRQVWFPGVHSNCGGGYDDMELANITLAWMMAQLTPFVDIERDYIIRQHDHNVDWYRKNGQRPRPWSFGTLYNSMSGLYAVGGGTIRSPGRYYAVDPETGKTTNRPLRDTHEYIHPSVRTRYFLKGPGAVDKEGMYDPESMDDWKLVVEYPDGPGRKPDIFWKARFSDRNVTTRLLPESPVWDVEKKLLRLDPDMEQEVLRPPPTNRLG
jgi:hypothetical protein